jgi:HD-GYP domain-containing protein (c-di-GMP phosphodiesterase class II)
VLLLLHRCADGLDQDLPDFFQSLALQAAIAIDNVELFQGLKQSNSELSLAYDQTIKGWAQALELRSADTRGHCDRVVQLSEVLARALGMSEEHLVHFRRGVMLHDIGKLGIPDSILLKKDSLTEEEWKAIHMHPVYGYEMLRDIEYLRPAVNVPYCHHERWDGSGYPRGLAGLEIPREARIFAVVDAWDALINERPYHPPWPPQEAIEYLIDQSGKQFDPEVVAAFLLII